jgi:hypothetical protein
VTAPPAILRADISCGVRDPEKRLTWPVVAGAGRVPHFSKLLAPTSFFFFLIFFFLFFINYA